MVAALLTTGEAMALEDLRWQSRPLLIVSASADDPRIGSQIAALPEAGVLNRQMVVVVATPEGVTRDGAASTDDYDALRRRYGVSGSFSVLLIGKDGGVKRRSDAPVTAASLFDQIDGMPMRRREMREAE